MTTIETNIKIIKPGPNLRLKVQVIQLDGHKLSKKQVESLCNKLSYRHSIAAIPFYHDNEWQVIVRKQANFSSIQIKEENWAIIVDLENAFFHTLNYQDKNHQELLAEFFKRNLLIQIVKKTNWWRFNSPRIFYKQKPLEKMSGVSAFERFEISTVVIESAGIGISIETGMAYFTSNSVAFYIKNNREDEFLHLIRRQQEQKGTLLYKGPKGAQQCYFVENPHCSCKHTPRMKIEGKSYRNIVTYYKENYNITINPNSPAVVVSFIKGSDPVHVPAEWLFVRLMNNAVPWRLEKLSKIPPHIRRYKINEFWKQLGNKPFGIDLNEISYPFYAPQQQESGRIDMPALLFGKGQILKKPQLSTPKNYNNHFRQRKRFLTDANCFHVPPNIPRKLFFACPHHLKEVMYKFGEDACKKVSNLTGITVTPIIYTYEDSHLEAVIPLSDKTGVLTFVMNNDPALYFNIAYDLKNLNIKRITEKQLLRHGNYLKENSPKGQKRWDTFVEMNVYSIIQLMGNIPWIPAKKLNYDIQLAIDVSEKFTYLSISAFIWKEDMYFPIISSQTHPKTNSKSEKINPIVLEKHLTHFFNDNRFIIKKYGITNMLILRDGKDCKKEYQAIVQTIKKLQNEDNPILKDDFHFDFVEYRKSTQKNCRLWSLSKTDRRIDNVLEGTYFLPNHRTAFFSVTGAGTISQGTANPILIESKYTLPDMTKVLEDIFALTQLNYASPSVAQRYTLPIKVADEELKNKRAQEIVRIQ